MHLSRRFLIALGFAFLASGSLRAQTSMPINEPRPWWRDRPYGPAFVPSEGTPLPRIRVLGNRFVDPDAKPVLFRGVSISDPDKLVRQGHWDTNHFLHIKELGANLVRIPVHPGAWRAQGKVAYLRMLDDAVRWCTDLGIYVDIDWHSIGNLQMELFQDPMYDTSRKETFEFWRTIAQHYRGNSTVAFYELFNEPTLMRGQLGSMSWSEWKKLNEDMIRLVRAFDTNTIPLVAGLDWAYDLTPLNIEPLQAERIGYVVHPYPNKRPRPWEPRWDVDFGFAAARYPVIATEIGFSVPKGTTVKDDDYGRVITRYLESRGMSWVAWCYDPEWGPTLLRSWNYELTGSGEFFRQVLHEPVAEMQK
jgi:hypothetical protein